MAKAISRQEHGRYSADFPCNGSAYCPHNNSIYSTEIIYYDLHLAANLPLSSNSKENP